MFYNNWLSSEAIITGNFDQCQIRPRIHIFDKDNK